MTGMVMMVEAAITTWGRGLGSLKIVLILIGMGKCCAIIEENESVQEFVPGYHKGVNTNGDERGNGKWQSDTPDDFKACAAIYESGPVRFHREWYESNWLAYTRQLAKSGPDR